MLSYCTLCLLEYLEVIPNARFPQSSMLPTPVSRLVKFCIQARHLQIFFVAFDLLNLGSTIDVACQASHSARSWPWRCNLSLLATSSRFGEIPGGKGLGRLAEVPLHDRGIDPSWSSPHGVSRNWPITFLSLREPRRRHRLVRSARGLSPTTLRTWVAPRKTMCPSASSSLNTTTVFVDALPDLAIHRLELPEAQVASRSLHMQQPVSIPPIWAASLDMVTRSSHSADAKPARRPDSMLVPSWASLFLHSLHEE